MKYKVFYENTEKLYAHKVDNLEEMDRFLETYHLLKIQSGRHRKTEQTNY